MKSPLLPALLLALALAASAHAQTQVQVQVDDVDDSRTTGHFFAGLKIHIKLSGAALADAAFIRTAVVTATDDTGVDLLDPKHERKEFVSTEDNGQAGELQLDLKNPARKAVTIKQLTGEADLFVPKNDPAAVVKVPGILKTTGKALVDPALAAAGIEITKTADESNNGVTLKIKDPNQKLVAMEFQDAGGKKIKNEGWSTFTDNISKVSTKTYDFESKLPDDAVLVIYIATDKSIVKAPFSLTNVPLP